MKIKLLHKILLPIAVLLMTAGCHEVETYSDTPRENFECLWQTVNDHYCFFREKGIDWDEVGDRYRAMVTDKTNPAELWVICSTMLDELRDGHVNLATPFAVSYYRKWWSDYPQDFNWRTVQQYYLNFKYNQVSGMYYGILEGNVGYIHIPSFSNRIGSGNLDYVLAILSETDGLVIDIRDNGGGLLTNIDKLVSRFLTEKTVGGYIYHKTGPGHDEFSSPYAIEYEPCEAGRVPYTKRVAVLTNRSCFSAANDFVGVMQYLPQVRIVGARTGGGGGLPFSSELPNGWTVRFSACPINDSRDLYIEEGVDPSPGFEVHSPDEELAAGVDAILEAGIRWAACQPKAGL